MTSTSTSLELRVYVPEGLSHAKAERLRRTVDTCPVKRALEAGFTFDERIVFGEPRADAELASASPLLLSARKGRS